MSGSPDLGAWMDEAGTHFRVWSPTANLLELEIVSASPSRRLPMRKDEQGYHTATVPHLAPGTLYRYPIDGGMAFPDPASRFQPQGVHGPSEIIDLRRFPWSDENWTGIDLEHLVLYELHVGTFSPEGTFAGVEHRLPYLRDLGVTAIELMPVAEFPGRCNWGYDGVDLFAPSRNYGRPEDLQRLVNRAHDLGLAVFLDVVYNHLGPEGAYLGSFSPHYYSPKHKCPWGDAVNLDDRFCEPVRHFFIENALHWIHEYHIDGLRLDATHAMVDESPTHFLKELNLKIRATLSPNRKVLIVAEDDRNDSRIIRTVPEGGYGLDAVWADDLHHQMRCHLAGDREGYFQDFSGTVADLSQTLRLGWFYTGQTSAFRNAPRGSNPEGIPLPRFVHCIQNHDQVGNRALGDRLNSQTGLPASRAATAVLLFSPSTPLLFMGQEWAATTPFCYFTDHPEALGKLVTEGRRNEFRHFKAFSKPDQRRRIPDPQDPQTFFNSRLNWEEKETGAHRGMLNLVRCLLTLRRSEPALKWGPDASFETGFESDSFLFLFRASGNHPPLLLAACLSGQGSCTIPSRLYGRSKWETILTTEEARFATDPPPIETKGSELVFPRPGAVILRRLS
ncbi:MAG: malto-oligosyltrehalose trehalohydrolase [Nitrospinae bacterium CG11_big_fil_rev_8_21_14_0_20_56_8]|nr:MAG: malto-oligosyltrehalose trehalohydrolase [Nitrospinae bacterium CG11_big_fil_rev_8_21_14_0_20_56_8]